MRMVRLQIGQEKVKESVEVERQKLQEIADEVGTAACLACYSACKSSSQIMASITLSATR